MQTEMDKKKLESVKADLEYNLRASEYNVEILKNQNENRETTGKTRQIWETHGKTWK